MLDYGSFGIIRKCQIKYIAIYEEKKGPDIILINKYVKNLNQI